MRRTKQADTPVELSVGRVLRTHGVHYRKNVSGLPGRPDFANRRRKWAIFVNGCFWYHHTNCARATGPKSNRQFWVTKFHDNRRRDARAIWSLRKAGFYVLVVWECQCAEIESLLRQILEPCGINP
ncbi:MAG: very short patch repair endonuclease [Sphingomonadaceae bacterium]|nr:very short patch repair endonuclease [Sphingomonadaceae bacterium]